MRDTPLTREELARVIEGRGAAGASRFSITHG